MFPQLTGALIFVGMTCLIAGEICIWADRSRVAGRPTVGRGLTVTSSLVPSFLRKMTGLDNLSLFAMFLKVHVNWEKIVFQLSVKNSLALHFQL